MLLLQKLAELLFNTNQRQLKFTYVKRNIYIPVAVLLQFLIIEFTRNELDLMVAMHCNRNSDFFKLFIACFPSGATLPLFSFSISAYRLCAGGPMITSVFMIQILESPEIKMLRFPGLESPGKKHRPWKSPRILK